MRRPLLIARQSARPVGALGWLIGRIMARETAPANRAMIEVLAPGTAEHVLDLGCGPGASVETLARRCSEGRVTGLDHSDSMVRMASRRNASRLADGTVELRRGDVVAMPFADATFDAILSVHTVYFWHDLASALHECHRVLRRGGRLLLGFRRPDEALAREFPSPVYRHRQAEELLDALDGAGFVDTAQGDCGDVHPEVVWVRGYSGSPSASRTSRT